MIDLSDEGYDELMGGEDYFEVFFFLEMPPDTDPDDHHVLRVMGRPDTGLVWVH